MNSAPSRHASLAAYCPALALTAAGASAATAGSAAAASGSGGAPIVATDDGAARGVAVPGSTVDASLGLPYAAPPTGNLRWRPPARPADWRGVRDATQFGPSCPQPPSPLAPPGRFSCWPGIPTAVRSSLTQPSCRISSSQGSGGSLVASTLFYRNQDAVLTDPGFTEDQVRALGDWVAATGRNVTEHALYGKRLPAAAVMTAAAAWGGEADG